MSTESTQEENVGEIALSRVHSATIVWKIHDYFELPREVDSQFDSPTFSFLDGTWNLRLFTNGQSERQTAGWIALFLVKKSYSSQMHRLQFSLGIRGSDDFKMNSRHDFDENAVSFGWRNYVKTTVLNEKRKDIVPNGVLTVVCNLLQRLDSSLHWCLDSSLSANANEGVHAAVQTETSPSVEKLVHDFKDLLQSGEGTDLTLKVKDRDYKVHRSVLVARSAVFSAMMKSNMKEKSSGVVQIDDCDPEAFQQFLAYLYSGDLGHFSADTAFALYNIADKYDAQELKKNCVQFIVDTLSVETFFDFLSLSLMHKESELLEKVVEFFTKNLMNILVTVKWLDFAKENPVEANELHIKSAKYYAKLGENISP